MTDRLDLALPYQTQIEALLREHVPEAEVWAYGSRVNGSSHEASDLDLVLRGPNLERLGTGYLDLLEAIEESNIPILVQAHDWATLPESLRREIERDYVVVRKKAVHRTNCTLADACSAINYGLTASASSRSHGPKFLRITDIVPGYIDWNSVPHVDADEEVLEKYRLYDGDIVIARTGASTGTSAFVKNPPPSIFASYLVRLQARPDFDARFLAYFLKSDEFGDYIRGVLGDKSAQPNASASTMTAAPLRVPATKAEQRAIAHILGTLDDKIELNRRMNQTLEQMARALFKSWFVDFDPVRAKMDGRWRPGQALPGLPAHLYDLFPSRLVPSELGLIPAGWEVRPFGALLTDVVGGDWGKETPDVKHTEPVSVIRGTDLPALALGGTGSVPLRYTTKAKAERRVLRDGDIIIEVSGGSPTQSTGRSMMVNRDILSRFPGTVVCASFCRRFRPKGWREAVLASMHLDFLNTLDKMWEYQLQSTGIANFQTKLFLEEEKVVWPDESLMNGFAELVEPIVSSTTRNESITLATQRDTLLPKLMATAGWAGL